MRQVAQTSLKFDCEPHNKIGKTWFLDYGSIIPALVTVPKPRFGKRPPESVIAAYQRCADYKPEDRASVIAAPGALLAFVLG